MAASLAGANAASLKIPATNFRISGISKGMRISFFACLAGLIGLAVVASAADASGKWAAEVSGEGGQKVQITFNLKTEGDRITGSVSMVLNGNSGEFGISDGNVTGNQISFKQVMEEMTILYKGTISGNEIKFTRERADGQGHKQPFTAKKSS